MLANIAPSSTDRQSLTRAGLHYAATARAPAARSPARRARLISPPAGACAGRAGPALATSALTNVAWAT
jgi:hypothetical protein